MRFDEKVIHRFLDLLPRNFTFALEPRNKSWMAMEAFDLLRSTGVAYTIVDEPLLPPDLHVTSSAAYVRWHGHGTDPWYNYHYSEEELKTWVPRVQQVASQSETVFGFFNNHFHGYAPENCIQILRMLGVQTQEQARALQRIEGFRKQASHADVRLRSLTLEDFGADVPKDASVDAALGRLMDPHRLDRAKRIDSKETIVHDCEDWGKLAGRKDLCKHVGKFFLSLPKEEALSRLDAIAADRDAWTFSIPPA